MTKATDIQEFDSIAVLVDFATAHCALATSMVIGRADRITEKAIRIADGDKWVWLPKRALVKGRTEAHGKHFQLARWFRPDGQTARNIDRMTRHSVIAA